MTTVMLTGQDRARWRHKQPCAGQIRLRELTTAGNPPEADVWLLHTIAAKIQRCCGCNGLRAHRLALGWAVPEAVRHVHALCAAQRLGARGLSERSWREWEAGGKRPNDDYIDLLCRLFHTSAVRLGYAPDYTPRMPAPLAAFGGPVIGQPGQHAGPEGGPSVPVVLVWTGRIASAFRAASRMNVRAFADQLGLTKMAVADWNERPIRPLSRADQKLLDEAYRLADNDTRARLAAAARSMDWPEVETTRAEHSTGADR